MINFNFKKKFGQNFLTDTNLLSAIVNDANIKDKEVLEIGAGAGALTKILDHEAKNVISFEIDHELEPILLGLNLKKTQFIFNDVLNIPTLTIDSYFKNEYCLVANLPYYITSPILFKFLNESEKISSLTIMVQKEIGQRMIAKTNTKDYGILSVMINFYGGAKITRSVNRQMFSPIPNVDSVVVHIDIDRQRFAHIDRFKFANFIKACFSMRRKTLVNNLSAYYKKPKEYFDILDDYKNKRSEELTLEEFIKIYSLLNIN